MSTSKTVIVTGANIGLGFECTKAIAHEDDGWHIILACRSRERGEEAIKIIKESLPTNKRDRAVLECMIVDLNSLASVRSFASAFKARTKNNEIPPLKSLVCNAGTFEISMVHSKGIQNTSRKLTEDGFEQTFGINHLGHFLLVLLLAETIVAPARILIGTHDPLEKTGLPHPVYVSGEKLAHPDEKDGSGMTFNQQAYTNSKLCNVLFAYELNRRLINSGLSTKEKPISVNAYDPGFVPETGLIRDYHWLAQWLVKNVVAYIAWMFMSNTHTAPESGSALAALAISPEYQGITAKYFNVLKEKKSSALSYNEDYQKDLWNWSVKLCNLNQHETVLPLE